MDRAFKTGIYFQAKVVGRTLDCQPIWLKEYFTLPKDHLGEYMIYMRLFVHIPQRKLDEYLRNLGLTVLYSNYCPKNEFEMAYEHDWENEPGFLWVEADKRN